MIKSIINFSFKPLGSYFFLR